VLLILELYSNRPIVWILWQTWISQVKLSRLCFLFFLFLQNCQQTCAFPTAPKQLRCIMCSLLDTLSSLVHARVDEVNDDVIASVILSIIHRNDRKITPALSLSSVVRSHSDIPADSRRQQTGSIASIASHYLAEFNDPLLDPLPFRLLLHR